ncbi:MAG TPA: fumarate hydratase C-terminal domain-containing protein [Anaeromyxobacteraceae bacterium]|nr:fumarate hydratase C-terminal domain-containing protein [Anaeromyxobacteraceae bacterium]
MARNIRFPMTAEEARDLAVGDEVLVSGRLVTGRAAAHRHLAGCDDPELRPLLQGSLLYHCGPVVTRDPASGAWRFVAAGPTASMRAEPWEAEVIARYGLRGVMGKGGMGPRTLEALASCGAVYLHATGGLAVVLAKCVVEVLGVHRLPELGIPEALWQVEVRDFPAVVTMDAHRRSLHETAGTENLAKQLMG